MKERAAHRAHGLQEERYRTSGMGADNLCSDQPHGHAITLEDVVVRHQRKTFNRCLCQQEMVKRIAVEAWELQDGFGVLRNNRQKREAAGVDQFSKRTRLR